MSGVAVAPVLVAGLVATAVVLVRPPDRSAARVRRRAAGEACSPRRPRLRHRAGRRRAADDTAGHGAPGGDEALGLDLVAAAVRSGAAPAGALAAVSSAVPGAAGARLRRVAGALELGAAPPEAWALAGGDWLALRRCLQLADETGTPVVALLHAAAEQVRRDARGASALAAARLSVRIVLPLGLCALPAFLLLGVVPVVLSLGASLLAAR